MIFDTDIFIWVQKGHEKAARLIDKAPKRFLSVQTYMELLQASQDKIQTQRTKKFITDFSFVTLSLTENIGHRALVYVEEYGLSSGIRAGDALIAATAVENNLPLVTSNQKHFKVIKELDLQVFKP